ncbi:MAG TPA: hypothetical protein VKY31_01560, partial [Terriglobia bacterium]|nr:hypothetical protein [Terriglobia bacterium]
MRSLAIFGSFVLGCCLVVGLRIQDAEQAAVHLPPHRDGYILVGFTANTTAAQQSAIIASVPAIAVKTIGAGTTVVYVGKSHEEAAIALVKRYPEIRYAEPDFANHLDGGAMPTDSFAGIQWAISNTGQTINGT